jgi:CRP/FNR family transcriptional regulator, cyclic AMP receptor protein
MRKVLFILGQLTDTDAEWLIRNGRKTAVPVGATLIEAAHQPSALFLVLDGEFAVLVGGREIARIRSGEVVGEMSFVEARLPFASVIATVEATVLAISRGTLAAHLEEDDGFAARFYRAIAMFLSDRLRSTVGTFGYGVADAPSGDSEEIDGEIDGEILDNVALAGARFDRILKRLSETTA